ncbi:MAG: GTPase [Candidatus Kapaibacterium sp.]
MSKKATDEEEFDNDKYEEAFKNAYDEKQSEFDEISKQNLIISLIGGVNTGKSTTIEALTGIEYTEVSPIAGSTTKISLHKLYDGVFVADTPGLFDVNPDISKKASEFVENRADIILFFLNAAVGITIHEKAAFNEITKLGKKILVVLNQIDTRKEKDIPLIINQINGELGVSTIPISSGTGFGIENLNNEIIKILEKNGKDLLFLKISKYKESSVKKWIMSATATALSIGALPIPGSDIIPLTTLQVGLAMKIAYIYDIKPSKDDIMKLIASTITGSVGKQLTRWGISILKGAGWFPAFWPFEIGISLVAGSVAAAMTYGFGWSCNAYYKSGMELDMKDFAAIFNDLVDKYKNQNND